MSEMAEKMKYVCTREGNIVGREENAGHHFFFSLSHNVFESVVNITQSLIL